MLKIIECRNNVGNVRRISKHFFYLVVAIFLASNFAGESFAQTIEVRNNQPFAVKMPLTVKAVNLQGESWKTTDGKTAQRDGEQLTFVADLPPSTAKTFTF